MHLGVDLIYTERRTMKQIAIYIEDEQKIGLLAELLSSLDFVKLVEVNELNGASSLKGQKNPQPYISPEHTQMLEEESAFEAMKPRLVAQYNQQFVAIFHGEIVDHDEHELTLLDRINQNY